MIDPEIIFTIGVIVGIVLIGIGYLIYLSFTSNSERPYAPDKEPSAGPVEYVECCGGCGRQVDKRKGLCSSCAWDIISMGS